MKKTYGLIDTDEVRGDDGKDTVPEPKSHQQCSRYGSRSADIPVGSGGKTNTSRSDRNREDFTDNLKM